MNSKIKQNLPANFTEAENNKWACLSVKNGIEAAILKNIINITTDVLELCCFACYLQSYNVIAISRQTTIRGSAENSAVIENL